MNLQCLKKKVETNSTKLKSNGQCSLVSGRALVWSLTVLGLVARWRDCQGHTASKSLIINLCKGLWWCILMWACDVIYQAKDFWKLSYCASPQAPRPKERSEHRRQPQPVLLTFPLYCTDKDFCCFCTKFIFRASFFVTQCIIWSSFACDSSPKTYFVI